MWGYNGNGMYPYGYNATLCQTDPQIIDSALYYAVLCYQMEDVLFDINKPFYRGKMVFPVWPEKLKRVRRFCGTSLGVTTEFALALESDTTNVVVFRGTKLAVEWIQDAMAVPVPFTYVPNSGDVHFGFFDIYKSMRNEILTTVQGLHPQKNLVITGHSLGGALATLCTLDIAVNSKFQFPTIYTYGSPKVGKPHWVDVFNATINQSVRVVNAPDNVPKLPPASFGFEHVKGELLLNIPAENPHSIANAYIYGLAQMTPQYAANLCAMNPPGFCPPSVVR